MTRLIRLNNTKRNSQVRAGFNDPAIWKQNGAPRRNGLRLQFQTPQINRSIQSPVLTRDARPEKLCLPMPELPGRRSSGTFPTSGYDGYLTDRSISAEVPGRFAYADSSGSSKASPDRH